MTYQLLLVIMAVICSTNCQHGRTDDVNDDLTCVMKYQNWASPTSLTVNWTIPPHTEDVEDLNVNISWYTMHNIGSCPETRLTTCTWYYGHAMSFSFNFNFNVSVIITVQTTKDKVFSKEWDVDPDSCRKPPNVGHVQAESINSTCVNISWWYGERSECSTFDSKFYQISYGMEGQTKFKIYDPENTTLVTACNTSRIVCNLQPFTTYVFSVQVKLGDWRGRIRGHFSDRKLATIKTPEDVKEKPFKRKLRHGPVSRRHRRSSEANIVKPQNGDYAMKKYAKMTAGNSEEKDEKCIAESRENRERFTRCHIIYYLTVTVVVAIYLCKHVSSKK